MSTNTISTSLKEKQSKITAENNTDTWCIWVTAKDVIKEHVTFCLSRLLVSSKIKKMTIIPQQTTLVKCQT